MRPTGFHNRISPILSVLVVVNLYLNIQVHGYLRGAPEAVCETMFPGHRVVEQLSLPPYVIRLSSNSYSPKKQISVTVEGKTGEVFKGFMLAARRQGKTENFGRFIPIPGTHSLTCSNKQDSAITHSDSSNRSQLEFIWEAPATNDGDLIITGTVLESGRVFWTNVASEVIQPSFDAEISSPSPDDSTTTDNGPVSSFTTTEPPIVNEIRCASSPDCLIEWKMDKDAGVTHFNFSLQSMNANMYLALGLSNDEKMGDDSVMECLRYPNGSILAQLSYNQGYANALVASDSVNMRSATFENGWMRCSFTRRNTVNNPRIFNLDGNEWYLLVAIGNVDLSKPRQKGYHTSKFASGSKIDLSKNEGPLGVGSSGGGILISIHGSLMIFAWVFFASVGMFTARYSKTIKKHIKGVALWFQLHRMSMVSTLLFTVVGFIIIFVAAKGNYSQTVGLPYDAHPVLGIIVTILTLLNPVMAYYRPGKDSPSRFWFNWAHRSVGAIAFILADAAIFIGISWFHHEHQTSSIAVMGIFILYKVLAVLTMEILECYKQRTVGPIEMKAPGEDKTEDTKEDEYFVFIKTVLLIGHIVISFILSVVLVIFLNIRDGNQQS